MTRTACDRCLRRTLLLGRLAAYIERAVAGRAGSRARELLALSDESLTRAVGGRRADALLAAAAGDDPSVLRARLESHGCWALCRHDPGYPRDLAARGREAPAALLGRGAAELLAALADEPAVTVVGSRRSSQYGDDVAHDLARMLAAAGFVVISGMALGVDSAAHRGALDGGRTLAVLGSGPDRAYPPSNRSLHERIVEHGGAVISELPPGTGAFRWTFPARNRIMAALAGMTVVVEAAERSGSLITAEMAQEAGRDVGAVPGPVNSWRSQGTNALLHDGAHVVRGAGDVLDVMLGAGARTALARGSELDPALRAVLGHVEAGRRSADEVALAAGGDAGAAASALARLELLGYVSSDLTGVWSRTQLAVPDPREPRP